MFLKSIYVEQTSDEIYDHAAKDKVLSIMKWQKTIPTIIYSSILIGNLALKKRRMHDHVVFIPFFLLGMVSISLLNNHLNNKIIQNLENDPKYFQNMKNVQAYITNYLVF